MYVVHLNYGRGPNGMTHLVRCPNGQGKVLCTNELNRYLRGRAWRYAR